MTTQAKTHVTFYEFAIRNADYVAQIKPGDELSRGSTTIHEAGELDPFISFTRILTDSEIKATVVGYLAGYEKGRAAGAEKVSGDLRKLLGLASLEDIANLDARLDRSAR